MLKRLIKLQRINIFSKMSESNGDKSPEVVKSEVIEIETLDSNKRSMRARNPIKIAYEESSDSDAPKKKVSKVKKVKKAELPKEIKQQEEIGEGALIISETSPKSKKKSPTKRSAKSPEPINDGEKYNPPNWQELIQNMKEMRKTHPAPVDTMGCESCHDAEMPEKTQRFQKLVALMLSSQTKDEVTFAACQRLKNFGFTPESLAKAELQDLEEVLKPVGFYKTKAKHIQKTCEILIKDFDSDIPDSVDGLMKLPGVGSKMAHICMKSAWNIISGIGVDTHVHRISNRWKFVPKETKTPEQTRVALEDWLPREHWDEINLLMVGFGQTVCLPIRPKCGECLSNKICPAAFKETSPKKKKSLE